MNFHARIQQWISFSFLLLTLLVFSSCKTTTKTITAPYEYTPPPGRYISQWDVDDAKDAEVSALWAVIAFQQDLGSYPITMQQLVDGGYLNFDQGLLYKWEFAIGYYDSIPEAIVATYRPWLSSQDTARIYLGLDFPVPGISNLEISSFSESNIRIAPFPPYPTSGYYSWQAQGFMRQTMIAIKECEGDLGQLPANFQILARDGFIDSTFSPQWSFAWQITNRNQSTYVDTMWATSTAFMPLGAGHVVTYVLTTHEFEGYGMP